MPVTTRVKFFNVKPADQVNYTTLEIYHSAIGTWRFVTGQQFEQNFTLEIDAPRNPDESVEFLPFGFEAPDPEQGVSTTNELDINLGAVGLEVKEQLKKITEVERREPIQVIRREHLSGVTYPTYILKYEVDSVLFQNLSVSMRCKQVNNASSNVAELQTPSRFEGLGLPI